jgi:hypothetical protein
MGEILLEQIGSSVRALCAGPEPRWRAAPLRAQEAAILERECTTESDFDELRSRQTFYAAWKAGRLRPVVRATEHGKVIALLQDPKEVDDIPWGLWGRILKGFARPDGRIYTIFLCAHPSLRRFPAHAGEPVRPLHINGGYTYPCDPTCVFVYRAEDATRVLLHELLHAACTDRKDVGLEEMEAETEAWAELLWCAFLTSGDLKPFKSLVRTQSAWMRGQVQQLVRGRHMAEDGTPTPFPWRYTVGKEAFWQRWGVLDRKVHPTVTRSLRLTVPPGAVFQRKFEVRIGSVFL